VPPILHAFCAKNSNKLKIRSSPLEIHSSPLETHNSPLETHSSPLETHSCAHCCCSYFSPYRLKSTSIFRLLGHDMVSTTVVRLPATFLRLFDFPAILLSSRMSLLDKPVLGGVMYLLALLVCVLHTYSPTHTSTPDWFSGDFLWLVNGCSSSHPPGF